MNDNSGLNFLIFDIQLINGKNDPYNDVILYMVGLNNSKNWRLLAWIYRNAVLHFFWSLLSVIFISGGFHNHRACGLQWALTVRRITVIGFIEFVFIITEPYGKCSWVFLTGQLAFLDPSHQIWYIPFNTLKSIWSGSRLTYLNLGRPASRTVLTVLKCSAEYHLIVSINRRFGWYFII